MRGSGDPRYSRLGSRRYALICGGSQTVGRTRASVAGAKPSLRSQSEEVDTCRMATQPMERDRTVPLEEYLSTSYEPDCEYDEGVLVERNLGEFEHSFLQTLLATIFTVNMDRWGVFGLTEQRMRIAPRQYLIPDVCVLRMGTPREKVLTRPPLIAIEILSPEDTICRAEAT